MRIRYSRRATNDLVSIHEYLSDRSPTGSANVMAAIYATIDFVRRNPYASEMTNIADVRGRPVRRYGFKVFYRVFESDDVIEIIHVRHMSRKPWSGREQ